MLNSEENIAYAKSVLKEFDDVEMRRREEQYESVLESFKESFNEGNLPFLFDDDILYDEVRDMLENVGFRVKTVTSDNCGSVAYLITKKEEIASKKPIDLIR